MVISHSYVKLPEGNQFWTVALARCVSKKCSQRWSLASSLSIFSSFCAWTIRTFTTWTSLTASQNVLKCGCVWKWLVPLNPMVLLIIIPMKNGYFIGNINPTFSDKPMLGKRSIMLASNSHHQLIDFIRKAMQLHWKHGVQSHFLDVEVFLKQHFSISTQAFQNCNRV